MKTYKIYKLNQHGYDVLSKFLNENLKKYSRKNKYFIKAKEIVNDMVSQPFFSWDAPKFSTNYLYLDENETNNNKLNVFCFEKEMFNVYTYKE